MFAAKAGAKRVYAVDACPTICQLATELIAHNGLQDRVQVLNKRVEDIDKFEHDIDIIISEWMGERDAGQSQRVSTAFIRLVGFYLFHESMLESVIYARDHFLRASKTDDDNTPEPGESIAIFPSHAYLVSGMEHPCRPRHVPSRGSTARRSLTSTFASSRTRCGTTTSA